MRRSRRGGGGSSSEFGGSGEDSFVAVVVTKLTGALLFILLLTMVIMALLPKAVDLEDEEKSPLKVEGTQWGPLRVATPTRLPEAVAGRSYLLALAATGGRGPLKWSVDQTLPEWLTLDEATGRLAGTPPKATDEPLVVELRVSDGTQNASQPVQLHVLPFQAPLTARAWLKQSLTVVPWRAWLEQGVGFLVLWLVHLLGMNLLANLERGSLDESVLEPDNETAQMSIHKRFASYRLVVRLATLAAVVSLAVWLFLAVPRPR
jgi:preprotein translocase subunit SecG